MKKILLLFLAIILASSASAQEALREGFEIDEETLKQLTSQIPGFGSNERINIFITKNDGSQRTWGVIIKNTKVEISEEELENPTFTAEARSSVIKKIMSSSDPVSEAFKALKEKEIIIKAKTFKGKIKTLGLRIFLFFKSSKNKAAFLHEDADTEKTFAEPTPEEREVFLAIIQNLRTCNPADTELDFGSIDWEAGSLEEATIVAPHGTYDSNTDSLLLKITEQYPANYVIARYYETDDARIDVNRPTEMVIDSGREVQTVRATKVYNTFKNCVDLYEQKYYIEIHGNSDEATANEIEVATVGVTPALANYLAERFNEHKEGKLDNYQLSIEPLDSLVWTARRNKEIGMLSHCNNICLHFETPRALRERNRDIAKTADVLAALFNDLENYRPLKEPS